jgi:hypothetical protein
MPCPRTGAAKCECATQKSSFSIENTQGQETKTEVVTILERPDYCKRYLAFFYMFGSNSENKN